ncbi:MAG: hypothetical protein GAK29_02366 [Acinetobacter bereziniae]|uniref:Uncharacterized protein n=1 Tax=Acinetobacter bereziniae TaxID=106648 RepID=A0A833PDR6_ACIBZ|nr:MAG: hypothetical protein GAK29_02366 [Acinetobacter bereziniae]
MQFTKEVKSSDLAIRVNNRTLNSDEILDGGRLHPLDKLEQLILKKYLDQAPFELRSMCNIAIETGARIQTYEPYRVFRRDFYLS